MPAKKTIKLKPMQVYMHMSNGGLCYSIESTIYAGEGGIQAFLLRQTTSNMSLSTNVDILLPSKKAVTALIKMLQKLESIMPNRNAVYDLDKPEIVKD